MLNWEDHPFALAAGECRRDTAEVGRTRGWLKQANARIAASKRGSDLALKFVDGLDGVPARSPEERLQCPRRLQQCSLHRVVERRIRVLRRLRLNHRDVC